MEAGCDNGMGHVGEGADTMKACCDNGTGHVEDSHGEGAGGTVDGITQKERRIQSSYDTQGLLNVLSKVQKLANKRSGIRTIDTSHNYHCNTCNHKMNISMVHTFSTEFECVGIFPAHCNAPCHKMFSAHFSDPCHQN